MYIPKEQGLFIHSLSGLDPKGLVNDLYTKLRVKWLAIRVMEDDKQVNYFKPITKDDKLISNILSYAKTPGIKILFYVNIKGSDPNESKRLLNRIKPFAYNSAFGGIIVRVSDSFNIRTTNCAKTFVETIRLRYPHLSIGLLETSVAGIKDDLMVSWVSRVDYVMDLLTWNKAETNTWNNICIPSYRKYLYTYKRPTKTAYIPVISVINLKEFEYTASKSKLDQFFSYLMRDDSIEALGMWNLQSETKDAPNLYADGTTYNKTPEGFFWKKTVVVTPPVEPEPEVPVEEEKLTLESLDKRIKVLEDKWNTL